MIFVAAIVMNVINIAIDNGFFDKLIKKFLIKKYEKTMKEIEKEIEDD